MYAFGKQSRENRAEIHPALQRILDQAIQLTDFSIIEGFRDEATQNRYYDDGKSKLRFPDSKHNRRPSLAVDIVPFPIDWSNRERFYFLAGVIKGIAKKEGISIRWGGDWNSNGKFEDQTFHDLPHFELVGDNYE